MSNKLKRFGIITGYTLLGLYVLFLALPLVLSPIANSYKGDIEKIVKESTGFETKVDKISVVTSWNLSAGAKVGEISLSLPNSKAPFFSAKNVGGKLALLPIFARKIRIDSVFADDITADIAIKKDGNLLLLDYLPDSEGKKEVSTEPMTLPLGIKLSNHLPNVRVKSYKLGVSDVVTNKTYFVDGSNLKVSDFILDKKVKFSTNGSVVFDESVISNYDVKVSNNIMPNIQLHDLVFPEKIEVASDNQSNTTQEFVMPFNVIDVLNGVKRNQFSSNLVADIKTSGTFKNPKVDGALKVSEMTVAVDGKKLPESYFDMKFKGSKTVIDSIMYSSFDKSENTQIIGELAGGKKPSVDMTFRSNAKFNNLFRLVDSIAESFGYKDFETLTATGGFDADFNVKSDLKRVNSEGYFKVAPSSISYALYNVKIDDIKADVDLNNNNVIINDAGFSILGHPLKLTGSILADATTDLSLVADKLSLKGLIAACGQMALLKDNDIKNGSVSMNANVKGKLNSIKPELVASVDALNLYNKPAQLSVSLDKAEVIANYDGKTAGGEVDVNTLSLVHPMSKISVPTTKIVIDPKNINIKDSYLMFNNSKIDITGIVTNYLSDKLHMDLKAAGNLKSNDVATLLPKEFRNLIAYKGQMPLSIVVDGNTKVQNIKVNLEADPNNYIALADVDLLKGKKTKIHSNIEIIGDTLNLTNTGISNNKTSIAILSGNVTKLYTSPTLNLNLSIPSLVSFPIWGVPNSNMSANGTVAIVGSALNPQMRGTVNVTDISMSDFLFKMSDLVVDLAGPILNGVASLKEFKVGGIVATDITGNISLKDYTKLYLTDIAGKAFDGNLKGKLSYDIMTSKIALEMSGDKLNSTKAVQGAIGIPNALTGVLDFGTKLTMQGITDKEIIQSMAGNVDFNIGEGRFISIGRLENLVAAQNVSSNSILKAAISALSSLQVIQEADKYKYIEGKLILGKGSANISKIDVVGPLMAYHVTGKYNILPNTADLLILGRLDSKVVSVLGPLGELSADKLLAYIPKFGAATSNILGKLTANPEKENTAAIPALSSGSNAYKDFKVEFVGSAASASSVRSFKWLSVCDTSEIDIKQELKDAQEAVKNTVKSFKDAFSQAKSDAQAAKESSKQSAENLKNLFKGVLKNAQ